MNRAVNKWSPVNQRSTPLTKIIVIGAGPVGVRFVDELKRKNVICHVTLFGDEPYAPYNRVQLSNLLSRKQDYGDIGLKLPSSTDDFQLDFQRQKVQAIVTEKNQIKTESGNFFDYDQLVLATGSQPHVPNIDGANLKGVYTFRNLRDTEALLARSYRSRRTVVVGGGLLGLEAAHALTKNNTDVILVQQSYRLMNRQLDEIASESLENYIHKQGITIVTASGVRQVLSFPNSGDSQGKERVSSVVLRDETVIDCDTVLFCTGIKPNIDLAVRTGLSISRGIKVDDNLKTSKDNIFAIGECCEHNNMVYGIVSPGLEQAAVLADRFANGYAAYHGTQLISTLKVVGKSVCSMGEVAEITRRPKQSLLTYKNKKEGSYRKIVLHHGRLIGACAVGEWPEVRRIQEVFLSNGYLFPWQRLWFLLTGKLWFGKADEKVSNWPEAAIVCQCNQISRGKISAVVEQGFNSVKKIGEKTSAGTVCGSCQPLLQNLIGGNAKPIPVFGAIPVLILSVLAVIAAALFVFLPGIEPVNSVQTPSWEFLWTDGYWKQVTGFSLIGVVALGMLMSLRKRAGWRFLGNFSYWRLVHILLGVLALCVLLVHTGAHLGENLNRWLMLNFLLISAVGALAGITLSWASKSAMSSIQTLKKSWYWVHLLVVWPLPALLIVHVVSVYYF
ncbi:MAG: FAD-dependent oxidoreductase [Cellvibrionaceae bacterium]